jgi:hypothetical protein
MQTSSGLNGDTAIVAQNLVHLIGSELVVSGGDRRMRCEDAALANGLAVGIGRFA